MRIAVVSHSYVTPMNQAKVQALARASGKVLLLVPGQVRDTLRTIDFSLMPGALFEARVIPSCLDYHNATRLYDPFKLARALRDFAPDAVIIEQEPYSLSTWQTVRAARATGARIVLYSFQNIYKDYPFPFSLCESRCLKATDHLVVGSSSARDVWNRKGCAPEKITVLPQIGVDLDFFAEAPAGAARARLGLEDKFTLGFAGRLVEEKGVEVLINAAASLPRGAWQLLIVGKGPERARLDALIAAKGLTSSVYFLGAPTHEEMPRYLQAMDCLILPSLARPHWREQFGHVLIEAMSCGRPCVATDSDPMNEIVADTGFCFPEGDSAQLASALARFLADPKLAPTLGARARRRVGTHYTNDMIAAALMKMLGTAGGPT